MTPAPEAELKALDDTLAVFPAADAQAPRPDGDALVSGREASTSAAEAELRALDDTLTWFAPREGRAPPHERQAQASDAASLHAQATPTP